MPPLLQRLALTRRITPNPAGPGPISLGIGEPRRHAGADRRRAGATRCRLDCTRHRPASPCCARPARLPGCSAATA